MYRVHVRSFEQVLTLVQSLKDPRAGLGGYIGYIGFVGSRGYIGSRGARDQGFKELGLREIVFLGACPELPSPQTHLKADMEQKPQTLNPDPSWVPM